MCRGTGVKDVLFAQLLMIWLLCRPEEELSVKHQVHAVQNFKNAAHYDLKTVKISLPDGKICSLLGKAWSWRKKDRKNVSECNKESGLFSGEIIMCLLA